jgi:hypothetical protein
LRVAAGTVAAALEALGSQWLAVEVSAAHALGAAQCDCIAPPSEMFNAARNLQVIAALSLQLYIDRFFGLVLESGLKK